jgi:MoxR-like ATPases
MDGTQIQNKTPSVEEARVKIENVRQGLYRLIIGHEEAVEAAVLALVAREHIALIGPPGTAKSYLAQSLSRLVQARVLRLLDD